MYKKLISIICCPKTKKDIKLIEEDLLQTIKSKIQYRKLRNIKGEIIKKNITGALIRIDKKIVFPIYDDILLLKFEEAILIRQLFRPKTYFLTNVLIKKIQNWVKKLINNIIKKIDVDKVKDDWNKSADKSRSVFEAGRRLNKEGQIEIISKDVSQKLKLDKNDILLSIGSGSGILLYELKSKVNYCVGFDISQNLVSIGISKYKLDLIVAEANRIPFKNDVFNKALCYSVSHYFPTTKYEVQVINEILRTTKSNSEILIGDISVLERRNLIIRRKSLKYKVKRIIKIILLIEKLKQKSEKYNYIGKTSRWHWTDIDYIKKYLKKMGYISNVLNQPNNKQWGESNVSNIYRFDLFIDKSIVEYQKSDYNNLLNFIKINNDQFVPKLSERANSIEKWFQSIIGDNSYWLIRKEANEIVGAISARLNRVEGNKKKPGIAYITFLAISSKYRGQGISKKLLEKMSDQLLIEKNIKVVVTRTWSTNNSALSVYRNVGFYIDKVIKNDRGKNIDTIWIRKDLSYYGKQIEYV